jgi:hypothetical protein
MTLRGRLLATTAHLSVNEPRKVETALGTAWHGVARRHRAETAQAAPNAHANRNVLRLAQRVLHSG